MTHNRLFTDPLHLCLPKALTTVHAAEPVAINQAGLLYCFPIYDSTFTGWTPIDIAPSCVFNNTIGTQWPIEPRNRRHNHLLYLKQSRCKRFRVAWCRVISRYMNCSWREVRQQHVSPFHQGRYSCHAGTTKRVKNDLSRQSECSNEGNYRLRR